MEGGLAADAPAAAGCRESASSFTGSMVVAGQWFDEVLPKRGVVGFCVGGVGGVRGMEKGGTGTQPCESWGDGPGTELICA